MNSAAAPLDSTLLLQGEEWDFARAYRQLRCDEP